MPFPLHTKRGWHSKSNLDILHKWLEPCANLEISIHRDGGFNEPLLSLGIDWYYDCKSPNPSNICICWNDQYLSAVIVYLCLLAGLRRTYKPNNHFCYNDNRTHRISKSRALFMWSDHWGCCSWRTYSRKFWIDLDQKVGQILKALHFSSKLTLGRRYYGGGCFRNTDDISPGQAFLIEAISSFILLYTSSKAPKTLAYKCYVDSLRLAWD